jgi:hypothetical protein
MRGRARGKLGTCNQMLRMPQMPKEGCFAFSRLASHIRVLSKSGGKPALLSKTTIFISIGTMLNAEQQQEPHRPRRQRTSSIVSTTRCHGGKPVMISARFKFRTPTGCRFSAHPQPEPHQPEWVRRGGAFKLASRPATGPWAARCDPKCNSGVFYHDEAGCSRRHRPGQARSGRGSGSPQPVAIRVVTGAPKMAPGAGRIYDF